jgi:hypothetical protein
MPQNFITQAGYDPATGEACGSGDCVLQFGGSPKPIASVALIASGISFGVMTLLFTTIGTLVCWSTRYCACY